MTDNDSLGLVFSTINSIAINDLTYVTPKNIVLYYFMHLKGIFEAYVSLHIFQLDLLMTLTQK